MANLSLKVLPGLNSCGLSISMAFVPQIWMLIKYVPYSENEVINTAKSATATVGAEILSFNEDRRFSLYRCLNSSRVSHTPKHSSDGNHPHVLEGDY